MTAYPPAHMDPAGLGEGRLWGIGRRRGQYKRMAAVGSRGVLGVGYLTPDFSPLAGLNLLCGTGVDGRQLNRHSVALRGNRGPAFNGTRDSLIFGTPTMLNGDVWPNERCGRDLPAAR